MGFIIFFSGILFSAILFRWLGIFGPWIPRLVAISACCIASVAGAQTYPATAPVDQVVQPLSSFANGTASGITGPFTVQLKAAGGWCTAPGGGTFWQGNLVTYSNQGPVDANGVHRLLYYSSASLSNSAQGTMSPTSPQLYYGIPIGTSDGGQSYQGMFWQGYASYTREITVDIEPDIAASVFKVTFGSNDGSFSWSGYALGFGSSVGTTYVLSDVDDPTGYYKDASDQNSAVSKAFGSLLSYGAAQMQVPGLFSSNLTSGGTPGGGDGPGTTKPTSMPATTQASSSWLPDLDKVLFNIPPPSGFDRPPPVQSFLSHAREFVAPDRFQIFNSPLPDATDVNQLDAQFSYLQEQIGDVTIPSAMPQDKYGILSSVSTMWTGFGGFSGLFVTMAKGFVKYEAMWPHVFAFLMAVCTGVYAWNRLVMLVEGLMWSFAVSNTSWVKWLYLDFSGGDPVSSSVKYVKHKVSSRGLSSSSGLSREEGAGLGDVFDGPGVSDLRLDAEELGEMFDD